VTASATDKPAPTTNLPGQETLKDPGVTMARNGEPSGNLLVNNTSAGKTASQYNVQPGRIAQPGASAPQTVASDTVGTPPVQQAAVTTAQSASQSTLAS